MSANLDIGIDPTKAQRGADQIDKALEKIDNGATRTVREIEKLESSASRSMTGVRRSLAQTEQKTNDYARTSVSRFAIVRSSMGALSNTARGVSAEIKESFERSKLAVGLFLGTLTGGTFAVGSTIAEYERLKAALVAVTGSQETANDVFKALKVFAQETPSQLADVVDGFIKLEARGLAPSLESLRSYGNTAAAMGKSLDQFIEAVADAATGEFERLKEFGIKASNQGATIAFTFRGVTTEVKNSASEIEGFLRGIGETDFAGATGNQMRTVGGLVSNLKDQVSNLFAEFGEAGFSRVLKGGLGFLIDTIQTTRNALLSLEKSVVFVAGGFDRLSEQGGFALDVIKAKLKSLLPGSEDFESVLQRLESDLEASLVSIADRVAQQVDDIEERVRGEGSIDRPDQQQDQNPINDEALSQKLEALRVSLLSEEDAIRESYARRAEIVSQSVTVNGLSEERAEELLERLRLQQENELSVIRERQSKESQIIDAETKKRLSTEKRYAQQVLNLKDQVFNLAANLAVQLTERITGSAKAALAVEKGLAIAETFISGQAASIRALAELGPINGAPVAASIQQLTFTKMGLIAATGLLQASAKSGGGSISTSSRGGIGSSNQPSAPPDFGSVRQSDSVSQQSININITGDFISSREFAEATNSSLTELYGDGGTPPVRFNAA